MPLMTGYQSFATQMMEPGVLPQLEELTLCNYCKQKFNDSDLCPKFLSCRHYFCLQCTKTVLMKGHELFCVHCWKPTPLGDQGAEALQTYSAVLALANNFTALKLGQGGTNQGGKTGDKERKLLSSENCHTHGMPLVLWCATCCDPICRACAAQHEHPGHQVQSHAEAKEQLLVEVQQELISTSKMLVEIQRLAMQQREFLLKVLEACVTLKTHVETDLQNGWSHVPEVNEARETLGKARATLAAVEGPHDAQILCSALTAEKQRLQGKYQEMYLQCQLDDLIGNSNVVFDFNLIKQALGSIHAGVDSGTPQSRPTSHSAAAQNPILFLANYCMSQLYSRHVLTKQSSHGNVNGGADVSYSQPPPVHLLMANHPPPPAPSSNHLIVAPPPAMSIKPPPLPSQYDMGHSPLMSSPQGAYPLYYFSIDVNGTPHGRIVIEVRPDVAPKMAKNFAVLTTGDMGVSYKGCTVFQCWEGESVITGDFELNNGRGGRSIYEEGYFMPDDTKFPALRGAVGMRRTQKRHDNLGMVGSQFRIILQEMRGFTGIFGHVVEGLDLVEKISTFGDQTGKPTKTVVITKCGKL